MNSSEPASEQHSTICLFLSPWYTKKKHFQFAYVTSHYFRLEVIRFVFDTDPSLPLGAAATAPLLVLSAVLSVPRTADLLGRESVARLGPACPPYPTHLCVVAFVTNIHTELVQL